LTLSLALFSAAGAEMAIAWAGAAFQDTAARIASPAAANTPLRIVPSIVGRINLNIFRHLDG
jgi:hypothetical protein